MQTSARLRLRRASTWALLAASAALLAACASQQPKGMVHKPRSKEYFSEKEYGVKASPYARFMRRGGGRDQLGKPYQVRGKWYYPKEDKKYAKVGTASWYGDAFHGRYTANGEVYNVSDITAAHPTMPLPSYARVTNTETGSSLIVRVNDRGPYHDGRIIDLSKRAAQMLGYASVGTAKVRVEYVGRAPLDGNDQSYLMASYHPGNRAPDPSDGLPTGVMVAMNGSTPSVASASTMSFPGVLADSASVPTPQPVLVAQNVSSADVILPDFGPIVPQRPGFDLPSQVPFTVASLNYADKRVSRAVTAFAALESASMSSDDVIHAWKRLNPSQGINTSTDYVAAGTFEDANEARQIAAQLSDFGRTEIEKSERDGRHWYSVNVYEDGRGSLDDLLQAAWAKGAPDALAVRD